MQRVVSSAQREVLCLTFSFISVIFGLHVSVMRGKEKKKKNPSLNLTRKLSHFCHFRVKIPGPELRNLKRDNVILRAQRECTLKIKTRRDAGGAGAEKKKNQNQNQISWFPCLTVFSHKTAHSVVIYSLVKHIGPFLMWHATQNVS